MITDELIAEARQRIREQISVRSRELGTAMMAYVDRIDACRQSIVVSLNEVGYIDQRIAFEELDLEVHYDLIWYQQHHLARIQALEAEMQAMAKLIRSAGAEAATVAAKLLELIG